MTQEYLRYHFRNRHLNLHMKAEFTIGGGLLVTEGAVFQFFGFSLFDQHLHPTLTPIATYYTEFALSYFIPLLHTHVVATVISVLDNKLFSKEFYSREEKVIILVEFYRRKRCVWKWCSNSGTSKM